MSIGLQVFGRNLNHMFFRYLSIILVVITNVGFFYHHFLQKTCAHYFCIAPVFKGAPPMPCTVWLGETDQASSPPDGGVACNPGYPVDLCHSVPYTLSLTTSYRAYNISYRNVWVGRALILAYIVVVVVCHYDSSSDDFRPYTSPVWVVQFSLQSNLWVNSLCQTTNWLTDSILAVMINVSATLSCICLVCIKVMRLCIYFQGKYVQ